MRDVHVIYTDFTHLGQGWDVSCPQAPTLFAGGSRLGELMDDMPDLLALAGIEPGTYRLWQHEQKYAETPSGHGYYLRFLGLDDPHEDDRFDVIGRQLAAVESGDILRESDRQPSLPGGERLIIAVHPDDLFGWVADQLGEEEGCLACWSGDRNGVIYTIPIFDGLREFGEGGPAAELGLTRNSTIADVFDVVTASEMADLVTKNAPPHRGDGSRVKGLLALR